MHTVRPTQHYGRRGHRGLSLHTRPLLCGPIRRPVVTDKTKTPVPYVETPGDVGEPTPPVFPEGPRCGRQDSGTSKRGVFCTSEKAVRSLDPTRTPNETGYLTPPFFLHDSRPRSSPERSETRESGDDLGPRPDDLLLSPLPSRVNKVSSCRIRSTVGRLRVCALSRVDSHRLGGTLGVTWSLCTHLGRLWCGRVDRCLHTRHDGQIVKSGEWHPTNNTSSPTAYVDW